MRWVLWPTAAEGKYAHHQVRHPRSITTFATQLEPVMFNTRRPFESAPQGNLMVTKHLNADSAAARVGDESVQQFSREYARMFEAPPKRDGMCKASGAAYRKCEQHVHRHKFPKFRSPEALKSTVSRPWQTLDLMC
uniref:Uncharacterized protein n=1 Tax=Agrobacterium genomosp. 6 TaxID=1183411 RepID=A0A2Z2PC48_9HYPH|nr:hypothetical protein [Agrobacterium genomosp. 6]